MRPFLAFLAASLAGAPAAAAQPPADPAAPVVAAIERHFPGEAAAGGGLAAVDSFIAKRASAIAAAPPAMLIEIEARHAALLRALGSRDSSLCALAGDRGLFSPDVRAGAAQAPGLADFGVALVEAARAGASAPGGGAAAATAADFRAWLDAVKRIEPDVPVEAMLLDKAVRDKAPADHLCRGAAAMHEAVAALPPEAAARMARQLVSAAVRSGR